MLKFELTEQQVAVIGKALGAQPYDLAAPVIAELQKQIAAQQKPKEAGELKDAPLSGN
jgi:hypothetical protein